ncbi:hypothetical protein JTE90_001043 [Oedothorax gibbosus]|uniref:Mutator-like transposase domain-containing protein n=1 Tax=Oedothorax gibbosus TaxID=931172 RepID=A0AAV6UIM9_9ARAC|nr:hypothetical protein JTE90_001043 [Oedothorax gibbosus]
MVFLWRIFRKLCEEVSNKEESTYSLTGRRVVELGYFLDALKDFLHHDDKGRLGCTFHNVQVCGEIRKGLNSGLKLKCAMCNFEKTVWTNDTKSEIMDVNKAATIGIMEIGFSNLQDLTAILNIPPMSNTLFQKEQNIIADAWAKTAAREMELAIEEEKRLAKERGDVEWMLMGMPS